MRYIASLHFAISLDLWPSPARPARAISIYTTQCNMVNRVGWPLELPERASGSRPLANEITCNHSSVRLICATHLGVGHEARDTQCTRYLASAFNAAILLVSSSSNVKITSRFCRIRSCLTDLGITTIPRASSHAVTTWAGLLSCFFPIAASSVKQCHFHEIMSNQCQINVIFDITWVVDHAHSIDHGTRSQRRVRSDCKAEILGELDSGFLLAEGMHLHLLKLSRRSVTREAARNYHSKLKV